MRTGLLIFKSSAVVYFTEYVFMNLRLKESCRNYHDEGYSKIVQDHNITVFTVRVDTSTEINGPD